MLFVVLRFPNVIDEANPVVALIAHKTPIIIANILEAFSFRFYGWKVKKQDKTTIGSISL